MKLLVLGWYYSSNLGDAVLCDCVAWLLRRQYPQAEIVVKDMGCRENFPSNPPFSLQKARKERYRHLLRAAAAHLGWDKILSHEQWCRNQVLPKLEALAETDCDGVVFAGGQLFMDSLALYVEFLTERFTARGIPVFFNACGAGPSWSPTLQAKIGRALCLPGVKSVTCRDNTLLVNRWCGRDIAVPTADPGLWAAPAYGISKSPNARTIGLGVMQATTLSPAAAFRFWRRLIRRMEREGLPWKLFTNGSEGDDAFARKLLNSLNMDPARYLCPPPKTPRALVETIGGFRSLIAFRLHSHIIACSLGIPTVAVTWDAKLPFFFEKLGCPERCFPISAKPGAVLRALSRAEGEGAPRSTITAQREEAANRLFSALAPYTKRGTP